MADFKKVIQLAINCGFSHVQNLDADSIVIYDTVREACQANKCKKFATNWACPPGCGTLKDCESRIRKYKQGLILQTTGVLSNSYDYKAMSDIMKKHKTQLVDFSKNIKKYYPEGIVIGAGGCEICEKCTYPENPCRFPDKMIYSMEALGMLVNEVCRKNDLPYYYGVNTLTFVGCVLIC